MRNVIHDSANLKAEAENELTNHILPWWIRRMPDTKNGGFLGRIDGNDHIVADSPKGGILNARILWTFSAAYNLLKTNTYLEAARYSRDFNINHFFDTEFGGTFWSLDATGKPLDTKKQIYSQAFFIYALSEYYIATGDPECKERAIALFELIEKHSFDKHLNGYYEAFDRQWNLLNDLRLSAKDANEKKTMNTHLHILEAYSNLYRIWPDESLRIQLYNLIRIFLDKIIDAKTHHLRLFFDEEWNCKSAIVSYGHDIEASWLLYEAAAILQDYLLTEEVKSRCLLIAEAAAAGLNSDGSLAYETDIATGHTDHDRHWWPQAEAVVGFFNAFQLSGNKKFIAISADCFEYIKNHLIDRQNGEWYWSIQSDGSINRHDDKAGFWKCPYHNSRMCIELIKRIHQSVYY